MAAKFVGSVILKVIISTIKIYQDIHSLEGWVVLDRVPTSMIEIDGVVERDRSLISIFAPSLSTPFVILRPFTETRSRQFLP